MVYAVKIFFGKNIELGKTCCKILLFLVCITVIYSKPSYAVEEVIQPPKTDPVELNATEFNKKEPLQAAPEVPQETLPNVDLEKETLTDLESTILDSVDGPRDYLSEQVVSISQSIDHFFGEERYFQENNKSVIQLELNETFKEGGDKVYLFEGKAKLDLPAAQRRFQLVLESNPEQKSSGDIKKDQPAAAKEPPKPTQYSASLRYEKSEESLWHYSTELGAKFQFPLDPFARLRGSYVVPVAQWRLNLTETLFWFGTIGLGETTQFDMERVLTAPFLFRATSTATCLEAPQNCDLRQDVTLYHTLNERTALLYQASVLGVSEPELAETAYVLLMRYRYRLHKEWVFLEVTPQLNFPSTDGFKLNASLLFRLEILFGAKQ